MHAFHPRTALVSASLAFGLAGCVTTAVPPAASARSTAPVAASTVQDAIANLASASGSLVSGRLTLAPMGDGVHLRGELGGFRPGSSHGFHIHETGDCSAADASSAGGHFNPGTQPHGRAGQGAHHAGDADNIVADSRGVAKVDVHVRGVRLGGGSAIDIVGRAVVAHAVPDDYRSQPAGNAGARLACGVIRPVR